MPSTELELLVSSHLSVEITLIRNKVLVCPQISVFISPGDLPVARGRKEPRFGELLILLSTYLELPIAIFTFLYTPVERAILVCPRGNELP